MQQAECLTSLQGVARWHKPTGTQAIATHKTPLKEAILLNATLDRYAFSVLLISRGAAGYCFVELTDEATAERCLRKVNGKALPGATPVNILFNKATWMLWIQFCVPNCTLFIP